MGTLYFFWVGLVYSHLGTSDELLNLSPTARIERPPFHRGTCKHRDNASCRAIPIPS